MTPGQTRALEQHWPRYGVPSGDTLLDLDRLFGRSAPRVLEIGFGMGDALLEMAAAAPDHDFLGIDVHRPGIGRLLAGIEATGLSNVRVAEGDALQLLRDRLPAGSLARLLLFFPDPWPKKRHHKRRLVQPAFAALATGRLGLGGVLHAATDWEEYAEQMLAVFEECAGLVNTTGEGRFAERPTYRPLTKFEQRGLVRGHGVWDLLFRRS